MMITKIHRIANNNPVRIQFTNGNVTRYVYSATGEKLRVVYQTAVPNITVAMGSTRELMPSEILYTDSTDYLLGGSLTLRNGRIDKYQFEEGYCQATQYNATQDNFMFYYYDRDHLGNVRQVTKAMGSTGTVMQTMNYYPFGSQFCDGSAASGDFQQYKYNGKELDKMHGLNTYDYGARQYNPVTARWDRMDPMAEKYYSVSPYVYCAGNPVKYMDKDGMEIWIYYMDGDGQLQSFQYTADMECEVDNTHAQTIVANLNTMFSNGKGREVINSIIAIPTKFGYMQADTHSEGAEGYFDMATNITSLNDVSNTNTFAEEIFHTYQRVHNQGGATDVNEVEAKLFSAIMNCEIRDWNDLSYINNLYGLDNSPYSDSMIDLFENGYSQFHYENAVNNFFSGSPNGIVYKNLPGYKHGKIQKNPLIKHFLPANY